MSKTKVLECLHERIYHEILEKFGSGSVMIWGRIIFAARTNPLNKFQEHY